jgi:hypothetical protein
VIPFRFAALVIKSFDLVTIAGKVWRRPASESKLRRIDVVYVAKTSFAPQFILKRSSFRRGLCENQAIEVWIPIVSLSLGWTRLWEVHVSVEDQEYVSKQFEQWNELAAMVSKERDSAKLAQLANGNESRSDSENTVPRSFAARPFAITILPGYRQLRHGRSSELHMKKEELAFEHASLFRNLLNSHDDSDML